MPLLEELIVRAHKRGVRADEQLFNINRFSSRHKRETMNSDQILATYKEMKNRLGFAVSPHRFRHTIGTDLMNRPNANLHVVKELLGHTNISTTLEYVTPDMEQIRNALRHRPSPIRPETMQTIVANVT